MALEPYLQNFRPEVLGPSPLAQTRIADIEVRTLNRKPSPQKALSKLFREDIHQMPGSNSLKP